MPTTRKPSPIDTYRTHLQQLSDWDDYLRQESRLPGPRANLELLEAVIQAGDGCRFAHLLALDSDVPRRRPAQHARRVPHRLRRRGPGQARRRRRSRVAVRAAPPRRRRALACARSRRHRPPALGRPRHARPGRRNGELEHRRLARTARRRRRPRRTAPAALCRRASIQPPPSLPIFDTITECIVAAVPAARRDPDYQVLRQALAYAWSVLVAANPATCRPAFERWLLQAESTHDKDLLWIARQNLKKNRLLVLDAAWANSWATRLASDVPGTLANNSSRRKTSASTLARGKLTPPTPHPLRRARDVNRRIIVTMLTTLRQRARAIKRDTLALYLAARHPDTPWYAKALAVLIVGYALSPIDLIPDFIPVLGYLDDVILLPAGIFLCIRLIPAHVLDDCRAEAAARFAAGKPTSRTAAVVIVLIWLALLLLASVWIWRTFFFAQTAGVSPHRLPTPGHACQTPRRPPRCRLPPTPAAPRPQPGRAPRRRPPPAESSGARD